MSCLEELFDGLSVMNSSLIQLHIKGLYPYINENILTNSLQNCILSLMIKIPVKSCRKSLLSLGTQTCKKKLKESSFAVTIVSFDGAGICEPMGLFTS